MVNSLLKVISFVPCLTIIIVIFAGNPTVFSDYNFYTGQQWHQFSKIEWEVSRWRIVLIVYASYSILFDNVYYFMDAYIYSVKNQP